MVLIADTHALVWFLEGNARLSPTARERLSHPNVQIVIPAIALAEVSYLYARKRIGLGVADVLSHVAAASNCRIYPLDEVVVQYLPGTLNIHDATIVATALMLAEALGEPVAVVTKDRQITTSGLVNVVW